MGEQELITLIAPWVSQVLAVLGTELIRKQMNERLDDKHRKELEQYSSLFCGMSAFLNRKYSDAAKYFDAINGTFPLWQINYTMALGLSRACEDCIVDDLKVVYSKKATSLYSKLLHNKAVPDSLTPELLILKGRSMKVMLFAQKQVNKQRQSYRKHIELIIEILLEGLQEARQNNDVKWIQEAQYQLGCVYAMVDNESEVQYYVDELGPDSEYGEKLIRRIKERYNPQMKLREQLRDN